MVDELQLKANEIYDPVTGEIIAAEELSADELILLYARLKQLHDEIETTIWQLRQEAGRRTKDQKKKTTRLVGTEKQAKVVFPSDGWDNSVLLEAWHAFPVIRDNFLKIKTVSVVAREFKKLESATIEGNKPLEMFVSMLRSAVRPSTAPPTITIEN